MEGRKELWKDIRIKSTYDGEAELMKWFNRNHIDEVIKDFLNGTDYSSYIDKRGDYNK